MKTMVVAVAILLTSCTMNENVQRKAPSAEADGARFTLEDTATVGGYSIYVLHDNKTGSLIYLTPQSGVAVKDQ